MILNPVLRRKIRRLEKSLEEAESQLEERTRELNRINKNLERVIEIRTHDLKIAKNNAERANQAKSQFLANMSHEIRTPLNGIIGFIDILMQSQMNPIQKEQLEIIQKSGDFLLQIISDILEFSKIEAGKLIVEKQKFHLKRCIEAIVSNMAISIYKKNLKFNVFVDEGIPKNLIGDEARLRQILLNLLGNAMKYTPAGEIKFSVRCQPQEGNQFNLLFEIEDTGVGIANDKIESIFLPFEQADISDTRKYGGTGLGLAISRQIVHALGGELKVESQEAKGSKFYFEILLNTDGVPEFTTRNFKGRKSVLLISNEKGEISSIQNKLESWNTNVLILENTQKLNDCGLFHPDLILVELATENQISKDLQAIKNNFPNVKVGAIYAPQLAGSLCDKVKEDFDIFLQKPVHRKALFDSIEGMTTAVADKEASPISIAEKLKTKQILVAEDNSINQMLIEAVLKSLGYKVVIVEDGEKAVERFNSVEFDCILMDCQMPNMDGFAATRMLRKMGVDAPIIALTANAFKQTKEEAFDAGMSDFLTKPIKIKEVQEILERFAI